MRVNLKGNWHLLHPRVCIHARNTHIESQTHLKPHTLKNGRDSHSRCGASVSSQGTTVFKARLE